MVAVRPPHSLQVSLKAFPIKGKEEKNTVIMMLEATVMQYGKKNYAPISSLLVQKSLKKWRAE